MVNNIINKHDNVMLLIIILIIIIINRQNRLIGKKN